MNRLHAIIFRLIMASIVLCCCLAARTFAQTSSPSPKPADNSKEAQSDPFAPEPAQPLPAGMTGSDTSDPRAKLAPGWFNAGEASMGIKHVMLLKKPDAFQLGVDDPDSPKVKTTLGLLGIGDSNKIPKSSKLVLAQLAFANSDLAFQGNHLFQANFYGVSVYDISNTAKTSLLTT